MPDCFADPELARLAKRVAHIGGILDGQGPREHREAISAKFRTYQLEDIAAARLAKAVARLHALQQRQPDHQPAQYRGRRDWLLAGWPDDGQGGIDPHGAP